MTNPFKQENLYYNKEKDYYVCPMGQHMKRTGVRHYKTESGKTTNLLVIKDGKADVTEADCPDKLCVHQKAISKTNETIVCLPNKVVVQVIGAGESELDSIAR